MTNEYVADLLEELMKKQENLILEQLGDLVNSGLLVVESTRPTLMRYITPTGDYKYEIQQSVTLQAKAQEYILQLEKENDEMRSLIEKLKGFI